MSSSADRCPICGKPVAAAFAPFCSRRCADIDLGRWLKGGYVVPGPAAPESGKTPSDEEPEGD
jgi:endogenous inhibitor of DNA gyrase (YacG/DUF329 family)